MKKLQIKESTVTESGSIVHIIPPGDMHFVSLNIHNSGIQRSSMKLSISTSGERLVYLPRRFLPLSYGTILVDELGGHVGVFSRDLVNCFRYVNQPLVTNEVGTILTNNIYVGDIIVYGSNVLLVDSTLKIKAYNIEINGFLKSNISNVHEYGNLSISKERTPLDTDIILNINTGNKSTEYTEQCFFTSAHTGFDGIFIINPKISVNDKIFTEDGLLVGIVVDFDKSPAFIDDPLSITLTTRPSPAPAIPALMNFPISAPRDAPRCLVASGESASLTIWGHYALK